MVIRYLLAFGLVSVFFLLIGTNGQAFVRPTYANFFFLSIHSYSMFLFQYGFIYIVARISYMLTMSQSLFFQ